MTQLIKQRLRTLYGALLKIPVIGRGFRIPILLWRKISGSGAQRSSKTRDEMLNLAIGAVEALRSDLSATRTLGIERDSVLTASIVGVSERITGLHDEFSKTRRLVQDMTHQVSTLDKQSETVSQELLRIGQEVSALDARLRSIDEKLRDRLEFARAEMLFELRAKLKAGRPVIPDIAPSSQTMPRVVATEKLTAMRETGDVRLNLGCGHIPLEKYLNIDARDLPGVDLVADAAALPFAAGSVSEIYSSHFLEHFPLEYLKRVLLPYWHSLLRKGGVFRAIVPDSPAMLADFHENLMTFDDLRETIFGLQEYEGDFHFTMFSRTSFEQLLTLVGFEQLDCKFSARRNGKCRDMMLTGIRA